MSVNNAYKHLLRKTAKYFLTLFSRYHMYDVPALFHISYDSSKIMPFSPVHDDAIFYCWIFSYDFEIERDKKFVVYNILHFLQFLSRKISDSLNTRILSWSILWVLFNPESINLIQLYKPCSRYDTLLLLTKCLVM